MPAANARTAADVPACQRPRPYSSEGVVAGGSTPSRANDTLSPRAPNPTRQYKERQYEATVPTVVDRLCQQAVKIVLEPIFEADFLPCSYGFRPKRSATQAMEKLRTGFIAGKCFVFEADIRDFLES